MATATAGESPATVVYDAQAAHRGHPHQQALYSLRPGVDDNNLFSIDPTTGAVTFNASPTYHPGGDNTYDIVVTAHFGGQRVRQVVEIKVTDVAPSTPVDANPAPNIVAEGAPAGTSVGLTASSTDAAGEAITYKLTADSSGGGFAINPTTGVVTVANASKIDAVPSGGSFDVSVQATDAAGASAPQTFKIAVDPGSTFSYGPTPVVAKGGSASETPSVSSPEGGDHFALASSGTGAYGTASVNATTGVVTYTASSAPAAGTAATDSFTITDTDAYGAQTHATASFTVDGGTAFAYAPTPVVANGHGASDTPTVTSPEGGDQFAFAPGTSGMDTYGTANVNATTGVVSYTATSAPAAGTTATESFAIVDTDKYGVQTHATASFTVDGGTAFSYGTTPVVADGHSAGDTPSVTSSPEGGDSFAFASGGTSASGLYGTATVNAATGVVTYTATSAAAGTAPTDSFAVVDTDQYGAQTTATASFRADGGSAVTYATQTVPPGHTVTDTPTVTSPERGDTFAFVGASGAGATQVTGSFGTASIDPDSGVITYTASQGASGTTTLTVSDTDGAGATTTTTASFDDTDTWIGPAGGNWQTGSNWSFGAPPENDTAFIPSGSTPDVVSAVTLDAVALSNAGTIGVAAAQTFTLEDGTSIGGGAISIGNGAALDVESASPTGGSDATLAGVAVTNGGTVEVLGLLTLESGTTITGGTVSIGPMAGTLDVERGSGGGATLAGVLVDDSSGGSIVVDQNAAGAALTIENGTTIDGGTLTIASATGGLVVAGSGATLDEMSVTNDGAITVAANATLALQDVTIAGGTITNDGGISVAGTTVIEGGPNAASTSLSGGTVSLATGATLSLIDTAVSAQTTVAFAPSSLLALDLAQPFSASISGFGTGDTLDLTKIAPSGETVSWTQGANGSGTLTVSGSSSSVHFTLDGTYATSDFFLVPDSANAAAGIAGGGTDVLYVDRWNTSDSGDWTMAGDWTHGTPSAETAAVIDYAGTYTVSITTADTASVLYLDQANATVLDGTNGSLTLGGALNIEAGTFELAGGSLSTSTITIGSGGTLDFESDFSTDGPTSITYTLSGVTVANGGTVDVATASADSQVFLILESGTTITGGMVSIGSSGGTIDIEGPTGATLNDVALTGNGGQIEIGMTSTATLTLAGGTTITGAFVTIEAPGNSSGGTLDIGGASGGALLDGDVVTNGGTIAIANVSTATFDGDSVSSTGTIEVGSSATLTLDDDTMITGGTLTVGAGNGLLDIEKGAGMSVSGAELDGVAVTNSGTIAIAAAATLTLNGATLDSASGSLSNAGTIQIEGSSKLTLASSVTGTGTIVIGSGATLEVTEAENQTIVFAAATGTLRIDQPGAFAAEISSVKPLQSGDVFYFPSLYLGKTTASPGSYNTNTETTTLTIADESTNTSYYFILDGNYSESTFTVTQDKSGEGVDIADPPAASASGSHSVAIDRSALDASSAPAARSALSPHHSLADADHFVFDTAPLPHEAAQLSAELASNGAAHDGILDVSAIVAALHASGVPTQALFEAVENAAGTAAALEVNKGTVAAPHWVAIAHLDGLHAGNAVALAYDAAHPGDVEHIHVAAHTLAGHLG